MDNKNYAHPKEQERKLKTFSPAERPGGARRMTPSPRDASVRPERKGKGARHLPPAASKGEGDREATHVTERFNEVNKTFIYNYCSFLQYISLYLKHYLHF